MCGYYIARVATVTRIFPPVERHLGDTHALYTFIFHVCYTNSLLLYGHNYVAMYKMLLCCAIVNLWRYGSGTDPEGMDGVASHPPWTMQFYNFQSNLLLDLISGWSWQVLNSFWGSKSMVCILCASHIMEARLTLIFKILLLYGG